MTLELDTRKKYSDRSIYDPSRITASLFHRDDSFSSLLSAEKTKLLLAHVAGKRVLDIGCANGRHLAELAPQIKSGIGIDFSLPFVQLAATEYKDRGNVRFAVADARAIPLASNSIDVAFCFATMYHIDDTDKAFSEIHRVLADGGIAVLELGNARSFATIVARRNPHIARHSRRTIGQHLRLLRRTGFKIVSWRSFQILPMWGDRPRWLQFLRSPRLERLMARRYRDRLVDEMISSLPLIRQFAFRHLIMAQKG